MTSVPMPAPVASAVQQAAGELGCAVWLVGGAVRDPFLGRTVLDFDFAVDGPARRLARAVAATLRSAYYDLDTDRDAGRVVPVGAAGDWHSLDFARLRAGSIDQDLGLRDFTINAMARPLGGEDLVDPTAGLQDLRAGQLRPCQPDSIAQDPVRALRAVRLGHELGFRLTPDLIQAVRTARTDLGQVSPERQRDELFRLLGLPQAAGALRVANQMELLTAVLPGWRDSGAIEVGVRLADRLLAILGAFVGPHDDEDSGDVVLAQASLRLGRFRMELAMDLAERVTGDRSRRQLLVLAALYAGPICSNRVSQPIPDLTDAAELLRLSGAEHQHLAAVQRGMAASQDEAWLSGLTPLDHYRYFRGYGPAGVELILLALGCCLARFDGPPDPDLWRAWLDRARSHLETYYERRDLLSPEPLIRGDRLASDLGRAPGPWLGEALEAIREAQIAGRVTDRAGALAAGRQALAAFEASKDG
jgi:tRNA nucleotidyltransferase/poly(A) polymerase